MKTRKIICFFMTVSLILLLLNSCKQESYDENQIREESNLAYGINSSNTVEDYSNNGITLHRILFAPNDNALYYLVRDAVTDTCWMDYPQLYGMENIEIQNKVNTNIKEIVHSRYFADEDIQGYRGPVIDEVLLMDYKISCEVKLCNDNILSAAFFLHKYFEGSYYKEGDAFTVNINLSTGQKIDVASLYNIDDSFFDLIIQTDNSVPRSLRQSGWNDEYLYMVKVYAAADASGHIYFSQGYIGICAPVMQSSLVGEFSVPYYEVAGYLNQ